MPGAPLRAEADHRAAVRGEDEVGGVGVVATEVVHQAGRRALDLALCWTQRHAGGVDPRALELPSGVGDVGTAGAAVDGADRDSLAVLSIAFRPGAAADVAEEARDVGLRLGAGVAAGGEAGVPLRAPPADVNGRRRLNRATLVFQRGRRRRSQGAANAHLMRVWRC